MPMGSQLQRMSPGASKKAGTRTKAHFLAAVRATNRQEELSIFNVAT
jgi:hypothetical protein